jgi:hypothetical protein
MARWGGGVAAVMGHLAVSKTLQCIFHHLAHFLDVPTQGTLGVYTLHVLALSGRTERFGLTVI